LVRTIAVPGVALGSSLTRDGRLLLVADDRGAEVVSVAGAEKGSPDPVLGSLQTPASAPGRENGAIETASSASGRYVFVSLEYGTPRGAIAIFRLAAGAIPHVSPRDYVGLVRLGQAVVGSALSPNGQDLFVTSESAEGAPRLPPGTLSERGNDGSLSEIAVGAAERSPPRAVLASVFAGHQPVRVAVSNSGAVLWVTARADNRLLAFSAHRLVTDPSHALLATVKVGTAPVGLALFDHDRRIIVADSDRFNTRGARAALTIVNTHAALSHKPATIASLRSGLFPREIAIDQPNDLALITNFGSDQLETVRLGRFR
jgi:DNA-binding beta-propeller fold protein YncE